MNIRSLDSGRCVLKLLRNEGQKEKAVKEAVLRTEIKSDFWEDRYLNVAAKINKSKCDRSGQRDRPKRTEVGFRIFNFSCPETSDQALNFWAFLQERVIKDWPLPFHHPLHLKNQVLKSSGSDFLTNIVYSSGKINQGLYDPFVWQI